MIIKLHLLTTKHLTTEKWVTAQHSPGLGQGKDKRNLGVMVSVMLIVVHISYLEKNLIIIVGFFYCYYY